MSAFQLIGLPYEPFAPMFDWPEAKLAERNIRKFTANTPLSYPCRVSLVDAEPDERLLLLPFAHLDAQSPYQSSGPIFVREGAVQKLEPPNPYLSANKRNRGKYDAK